ncbi:hypothetical protein KAJ38_01235 [Candidatus Pacearchaeota archaeon]|nr:hypothetical protein [Candidatus Pacearchaeota archaeon]
MGYGDTYSREPKELTKEEMSEKDSLVSCLCNDVGYNREGLENTELESKIDVSYSKWFIGRSKDRVILTLGEYLKFPEPYSRDRILESSKANHSCYAFVNGRNGNLRHAFTKIEREGRVKIKVKGETQRIRKGNIIVLKRDEKNLENLSAIEVNKYISEIGRQRDYPLEYIGSFLKQSKEAFVFNPTSGRIFVVATNICSIEKNPNQLCQLEAEYYGQINGFSSIRKVDGELIKLVGGMLRGLPRGYSGKSSELTKFDWLVRNIRKSK